MEKIFEHQEILALFLLFFVPGFISLKVYDLLVPNERRDFSKSVYEAIAYSALNLGVLFWLFDFVLSAQLPRFWWYACWFIALVAFPAAWPVLGFWIRRHKWIANRLHNPNPRVWATLRTDLDLPLNNGERKFEPERVAPQKTWFPTNSPLRKPLDSNGVAVFRYESAARALHE